MSLKKLVVHGLFGHFEHTVLFNKEGITIITAPNGYGKTVMLKIIDSIFNMNFDYFIDLAFDSIELIASNFSLTIRKSEENKEKELKLSSESTLGESFDYTHSKLREKSSKSRAIFDLIDMYLPYLTRVGQSHWRDDGDDEMLTIDEIFRKYRDVIPEDIQQKFLGHYPSWLRDISSSINTYLIQDQRLILRTNVVEGRYPTSRKTIKYTDSIEKYANDLATYIRNTVVKSSGISQRLDSSFPVRLLGKKINSQNLSISQLTNNLKKLQEKREKLSGYNLLASDEYNMSDLDELDSITETDTKVLTLYVQDTEEKLSVYDDVLKRIELFSDILNNKRLSFKKIKINADKGFVFETSDGQPLELTQLSSGEQHQIVLLYELIFNVKDSALVLIDEPEISLHVAWQKEFLNDLKRIIKIQEMLFVVATHSPQIIDDRWDLTVDLEEGAVA